MRSGRSPSGRVQRAPPACGARVAPEPTLPGSSGTYPEMDRSINTWISALDRLIAREDRGALKAELDRLQRFYMPLSY